MAAKPRVKSTRPVKVLQPQEEATAGAVQGVFMGSRYWVWPTQPGAWAWRVQWGGDISRAYIGTGPAASGAEESQRDARAAAFQAIRAAANYHPPKEYEPHED